MKKAALFDLDGTLWDSSRQVAESWTVALKEYPDVARVITVEDLQATMGKAMPDIANILFPEVEEKRKMEILGHCVKIENDYIREHGGDIFDGLEDTLKVLKQKGYALYIISNCQWGYIDAFLDHYGFGKYFEDFACWEDTKQPKGYNIAMVMERNHIDRGVYVGDIQGDYNAATFAGLPFIHARMGFGKIDQETPYINSLTKLPELVEKIIG